MNRKRARVAVIVAFASLTMASVASAECIVASVNVAEAFRDSTLVFAGTVVRGNEDTLTFEPDRIWKGRPSKRATVWLLGRPHVDSYVFRIGERYLVFAHVVTADERTSNGIDDPAAEVFGIYRPCGSPIFPLTLLPELNKIARSHKPR